MPSSSRIIQFLILNTLVGAYTTWYLAENNDLFPRMRGVRDNGPHLLPGTDAPLRKHYTGIRPIDHQLQVLMVLFWGGVSENHAAVSIQMGHFAGQCGAAWALIVLEGCRVGNKGRPIAISVVWGLAAQNLAYACILPLFAIVHLCSSSTVLPTRTSISVPTAEAAALVPAILLGYILPSVMLALPAPSVLSYHTKQLASAIWQAFPLWVALAHQLLKRLEHTPVPQITALRRAYVFTIILSGVVHIVTVVLSLMPSLFVSPVTFRSTFVPSTFRASTRMASITDGAHLLMLYDEIVGSVALVTWTAFLLAQTGERWTWRMWGKVLGLTALLGPSGAAGAIMWQRDERVFGRAEKED